MSSFRVEISPPLPPASCEYEGEDIRELLAEDISQLLQVVCDVRYHVSQRLFCYYPSSILTALNDLHLEWDFVRKRASHDMTLSGYPVLTMFFNGERALFYDPVEAARDPDAAPLVGELDGACVEREIKSALDAVWSLIRCAGRKDPSS